MIVEKTENNIGEVGVELQKGDVTLFFSYAEIPELIGQMTLAYNDKTERVY